MTSPAITKSPGSQKNEKKSPLHSVNNEERKPVEGNGATISAPQQPPEVFGWLRIFKLADLMDKMVVDMAELRQTVSPTPTHKLELNIIKVGTGDIVWPRAATERSDY